MGCGISAFAAMPACELGLDIPDTLPEMPVCCQGGLMLCAECAYARLKEKRSLPLLCMFTGERMTEERQAPNDCAGRMAGRWDEETKKPLFTQGQGEKENET